MTFVQYYILIGISGLTLLTTFSLPNLFSKKYEKIGLTLLYLIIIMTIVFNINKWNLLWLAPAAFLVPYYAEKLLKFIPVKRHFLSHN